MGFSQALSGLNAASSSLDVLGNNIANSQTVGYKSAGAQFADVFAGSTGLGTKVSAVLQDFGAGNIEATGRELDLAVSGQGFYRFQQNGEVVYSRNGQLSMTPDGYLQNAQGARIMGYGINAAGNVEIGGQPQVLQVPSEEMPASATTDVSTTLNLDAREIVGEDRRQSTLDTGGAAPNDETTVNYHYSNNFTVYDSLGNPRNVTVYYEKGAQQQDGGRDVYYDASSGSNVYFNGTDYEDLGGAVLGTQPDSANLSAVMNDTPNTWTSRIAMDGKLLTNGASMPQQSQLTFDGNGQLTAGGNQTFNFPTGDFLGGGPQDLTFDMNLAGSTQFGNNSRASDLTQDGYTSGALVGITIEDDGTVMRNYTNEQSRPAGQIALANFRNPEGLQSVGDNAWASTAASGQELLGEAGTGVLGSIQSGAIETSNVDLAKQLVDMIVTQRAYQANSQTIKTQDEVLQASINLSR
ncbi:flagellar hook protein FlgE [Halomonas saccharevitans]|uniref:Flagellar hook protein FlgE n=1 Tax=Halomonas saccharevitans TaxID=416872 RepID=A0A1I6Z111_9GAMM|nr:flagellar hook protein FlgE [Halomonas saccharevitans]SFT56081.1 flagellar hook protein FlgE [Halomonas saccharevitans]